MNIQQPDLQLGRTLRVSRTIGIPKERPTGTSFLFCCTPMTIQRHGSPGGFALPKAFGVLLASLLLLHTESVSAQEAKALDIPLTAEEYGGITGTRRITCGVPLLAGQAKDIKDLRLIVKDSAGKEEFAPVQFRELARWWRTDNSLRWVLLDFAADIEAKSKLACRLIASTNAMPKAKQEITVSQDDASIAITTGPARFVIPRKKFAGIAKAILDLNGDGKLEDSEDILAAGPDCGTVIEDTYGQKYPGTDGTASVELLESGPLRVCVRVRGKHMAPEGRGYSPGMYGYDIFLNFYAGSTEVYADVIITNNPPKSTGSPTFEDASFVLRLAGGITSFKMTGEKTSEGKLNSGESVCLYQDSNGADTWEKCPGFGKMTSPGWTPLTNQITSFRGFKTTKSSGDKKEEIAAGNHARGLIEASNSRGGVIVHTKNFWQQFPKAAEVSADGTIRIGLFPRECRVPHYLEDASAKGHEIILSFFATSSDRLQAESIADCWDNRVYLRPAIEHIGACGALADMPYTPPTQELDKKPDTRTVANGPRMLTADMLYGNAYGWQIFGDRWRSNGGHGTRGARQPIDEDNYLFRWYVTNLPEWLAAGENRSRHFRDVRCYRIDGQDAFGFKDWKEFKAANKNEDWTNRPQPKGDEYAKYTQGLWERSPWLFPNPEHTTLDLLYDRYVLFGDIRCLENMRIAAAHGGYFAGRGGTPLGGSWPWRANGWGWRALVRYWDLTGDKAAEACLEDVMKTQSANAKIEPLHSFRDASKKDDVDWWFTGIYCRAASMTAVFTGDKRMIDLCKALAAGKENKAMKIPTVFGALYYVTGDEAYKTALTSTGKTDELLRVTGYFPACDHWLISQPPRATK